MPGLFGGLGGLGGEAGAGAEGAGGLPGGLMTSGKGKGVGAASKNYITLFLSAP
jgi:hypothetical protein